jgi:uncharacterized protein YbaR (Trm112 family)
MRVVVNQDRTMPIDGKLLEILCCPVSKTPLTRLPPGQLKKLNQAVSAGEVQYVNGDPVEQAMKEALITEDSKVLYPVVDGIPILLADKGIGTTQLTDF